MSADHPNYLLNGKCLYSYTIPGGCHWSFKVRKGLALRFTDTDGGANLGALFYNPENLLERYNAPDTLKCQHTFKLTAGHCLYSDMGRIFCSIVEDSLGWHETVCGNLSQQKLLEKYGEHSYQNYQNLWTRGGYESFLVEIAKYGLTRKDLAANVNFFSKVAANTEGDLSYLPDHSKPGGKVLLRFEMDTLVILHTCPHPLHPGKEYPRKPVLCEIFEASPVAEDDLCLNSRPENKRGFENNRLYHFGLSG
jgi:uncharacterized protein